MRKATGRYAGHIYWQRCRTRGESQRMYHTNMAANSGFETQRTSPEVQNIGISGLTNGLMSSENCGQKKKLKISANVSESANWVTILGRISTRNENVSDKPPIIPIETAGKTTDIFST